MNAFKKKKKKKKKNYNYIIANELDDDEDCMTSSAASSPNKKTRSIRSFASTIRKGAAHSLLKHQQQMPSRPILSNGHQQFVQQPPENATRLFSNNNNSTVDLHQNPLDFNTALAFVNQVKEAYADNPET